HLITEVTLKDTPSGDANQLIFDIYGFRFMAINAGPYFVKNPSISFTVLFKQSETNLLEDIYQKLIGNGRAFMPLAQYDFSEKYGWVQDQFDVSWQLLVTDQTFEHRITPSIMFLYENRGHAAEAMNFYNHVFKQRDKGYK
ncbi:VOC family protein, partial [Mammaliicoccus sciuri]